MCVADKNLSSAKLDKRVRECYKYVRTWRKHAGPLNLTFVSFPLPFLALAIDIRVFLFTSRLYVSTGRKASAIYTLSLL